IVNDWINDKSPVLGADAENEGGNGTSQDYNIPADAKPEDIAPESQYLPEAGNSPMENKEADKPKKELPKTNPTVNPANKPKQNPKAVMPKGN
ncbi:MAG: hypothetical protein WCP65_05935, partial [Bacteroidota bacterium]